MAIGLTQPGLGEWRNELTECLGSAFQEDLRFGELTLLCPPKDVADDSFKLLVKDAQGRPAGVVLCSPPFDPDAVADSMSRMKSAKSAMGPALSDVVLDPLYEGRFYGLSYTLLPYCRSLGGSRIYWRLQRTALASRLFPWLREIAQSTMSEPDPEDHDVVAGLESLAETQAVSPLVKSVAERALRRLHSGAWTPCRVVMHGDLWLGNVLLSPDKPFSALPGLWGDRFVIIDWGSSRADGFAFWDLVRVADSLRTPPWRFHAEIMAHARLLDCDPSDARSYLAAAIGNLGLALNQFPFEKYVDLANHTMRSMDEVLSRA